MSKVYTEMVLAWQGREYRWRPSNRLMRRIEGEGVSLVGLVESFRARAPRMGQLAYVVWAALDDAGCRADEDEVLKAILGKSSEEALALASQVLGAFFPDVGDPKKPAPPADGATPGG